MDIDRIEDCDEGMLGAFSDISAVLLIVVENSGIDSLGTGSVIIDDFPSIRTVRNRQIISGAVKRLHVGSLAIV